MIYQEDYNKEADKITTEIKSIENKQTYIKSKVGLDLLNKTIEIVKSISNEDFDVSKTRDQGFNPLQVINKKEDFGREMVCKVNLTDETQIVFRQKETSTYSGSIEILNKFKPQYTIDRTVVIVNEMLELEKELNNLQEMTYDFSTQLAEDGVDSYKYEKELLKDLDTLNELKDKIQELTMSLSKTKYGYVGETEEEKQQIEDYKNLHNELEEVRKRMKSLNIELNDVTDIDKFMFSNKNTKIELMDDFDRLTKDLRAEQGVYKLIMAKIEEMICENENLLRVQKLNPTRGLGWW